MTWLHYVWMCNKKKASMLVGGPEFLILLFSPARAFFFFPFIYLLLRQSDIYISNLV